MLKLRLSRGGTKKRPVYKVVVADSRFARDGRFIEKVGFFNPLLPKDKKERIGLEAERIKYWLGQGAQPTTRVARILGENELMPMPANSNNPQKAIPKKDRKKKRKHLRKKRKQKLPRKKKKQKHLRKKRKQKHLRKKRNNKNVYSSNIYPISRFFSWTFKQRFVWKSYGKKDLELENSGYQKLCYRQT